MKNRLLLLLCLLISSPLELRAAPIILGDGDDLAATVAAASDGAIIELQSNGSFTGDVTWTNEITVTIQAGHGYSPTVDGNLQVGGGGVTLRDLTVTGALSSLDNSSTSRDFVFEGVRFEDRVYFGGTRDFHVNLTARSNNFVGGMNIEATGDYSIDAVIERNTFEGDYTTHPVGSGTIFNISFVENYLKARAFATSGTSSPQMEYHRNHFVEGFEFISDGSSMDMTMSNNMFGDPTSARTNATGILFRKVFPDNNYDVGFNVAFVNNTVVGFQKGIEIAGADASEDGHGITFDNMLLYNNSDVIGFDAADFAHSLISDGTFAGQNGNVAAVPQLDANGRLLPGSPGIDMGDNSKATSLDLAGKPRVVDGDGDAVARVDAGAYEFAIPEPFSILLAFGAWLSVFSFRLRRY